MPDPIRVTLYNDAGCPWGYSANPALRVLEWRYGAQLEWRLVLIGLTEAAQEYVDRGYTPLRSAEGYARRFRRLAHTTAGEARNQRWSRSLHRTFARVRAWGTAARSRRLAADRSLRRARRQPDPRRRAPGSPGRRARAADRVSVRAGDPGGR